jgi:6-phosphogluconolactonase
MPALGKEVRQAGESRVGAGQILIGTYTERHAHVNGHALGLLASRLFGQQLSEPTLLAETLSPSFLTVTDDRAFVYVANETMSFDGRPSGAVTAYRRNVQTGACSPLGSRLSGGTMPAHLALDPSERFIVVANSRSGSIACLPRLADGSLGKVAVFLKLDGAGVHPVRQTGAHPHMIAFDPVTGQLLVPDLGVDVVRVFDFSVNGQLSPVPAATLRVAPGAGPRQLAFHPDGDALFVLNELNNTLLAARRSDGRFRWTASVSTLTPHSSGHAYSGSVRVLPSGEHVLASVRGPGGDHVAMFRYDVTVGSLTLVHVEPSGGRVPRDMTLIDEGRLLLVANQDSDRIVLMRIDEDDASIATIASIDAPSPVCVVAA